MHRLEIDTWVSGCRGSRFVTACQTSEIPFVIALFGMSGSGFMGLASRVCRYSLSAYKGAFTNVVEEIYVHASGCCQGVH